MRIFIAALMLIFSVVAYGQTVDGFQRTPRGGGAVVRPATGYVVNLVLSANTNKSWTAPTQTTTSANWVIIAATCSYWVRKNAAAVIPTVDVTDGTGSIYNPTAFALEGVTTLQFISDSACKVSLELLRG